MNSTPKQYGFDSYGNTYSDINEMWQTELNNKNEDAAKNVVGGKDEWYNKAAEYWEKTDASYSGVLGGYPELNSPDVKASKIFLSFFLDNKLIQNGKAIDCGAGIGRVSKELLVYFFQEVDLVDQNPKYVEEAKNILKDCANMKDFYVDGLQTFTPQKKYDCIWIQWVSNHLTDEDYVSFLKRCSESLTETGIIVVKENVCRVGFVVDKEDYSVTRADDLYRTLFQKANLKLIKQQWQPDFPEDLFKVNQYALRKA